MPRGAKKMDPVAKEAKLLGDEMVAKLDSASPEELKKMGYECANQRIAAVELRKADPDLAQAKEHMATASAPHREAIKRLDTLARWIKRRMEGKGMDTGVAEPEEPKELSGEQKDKLGGPKPESPNSPEARLAAAARALGEKVPGVTIKATLGKNLKPGESMTLVEGKPSTEVSHGFGGNLKPVPKLN